MSHQHETTNPYSAHEADAPAAGAAARRVE
jgi:hypothetical protein